VQNFNLWLVEQIGLKLMEAFPGGAAQCIAGFGKDNAGRSARAGYFDYDSVKAQTSRRAVPI
jgi:hypothetical protein